MQPKLSKIAIALACLTGNITIDPEVSGLGFSEVDDMLSSVQIDVGFSKAEAMETIIVTGTPPPTWDMSLAGYGGSSWGGVERDTDRGGSRPSLSEQREMACKAEIDDLISDCQNTYSEFNAGIGMLCTTLGFGTSFIGVVATTLCSSSVVHLQTRSNEWCRIQGNTKKEDEC